MKKLFLSILITSLIACSTHIQKPGPRIIQNPHPEKHIIKAQLEKLHTISSSPQSPWGAITDVALTNNQQLLILDAPNNCAMIISQDGKIEHTFGKAGQGPGELRRPNRIICTITDEIIINDAGNHRLNYYTATGTFIKSTQYSFVSRGALTSDNKNSIYLAPFYYMRTPDDSTAKSALIFIPDSTTTPGGFGHTYNIGKLNGNQYFSTAALTSLDNTLYFVNTCPYLIDSWNIKDKPILIAQSCFPKLALAQEMDYNQIQSLMLRYLIGPVQATHNHGLLVHVLDYEPDFIESFKKAAAHRVKTGKFGTVHSKTYLDVFDTTPAFQKRLALPDQSGTLRYIDRQGQLYYETLTNDDLALEIYRITNL
ncbi:6-bladed beta-propeller [bacterium]|nr:6-bladed beta-propeller [bacterium]